MEKEEVQFKQVLDSVNFLLYTSMLNFSPWRVNLTDYMRMHDENNAFFNNASKLIRESYNKAIDYLLLSL